MKRRLSYFLTAILICASTICSANVVLREIYTHYAIEPQSAEEIKQELRMKSPITKRQRLFHAGTQWELKPKFAVRVVGKLCQIHNVSVTLAGTYTLPKMTNRTLASAKTQSIFDDYYESLMEHEKGHQALWLEAGEKIELLLNSFPEEYQCYSLSLKAKQAVAEIVFQYQRNNRIYDKETGHGKTQGAVINSAG